MDRLMLYKKIHRQHVKQFRLGRKFKLGDSGVCKLTSKPFNKCGMYIGCCYNYSPIVSDRSTLYLINMTSGKLYHSNEITWIS